MAYFPDLSPYTYFINTTADAILTYHVGWLSSDYAYEKGDVPKEFLERLWAYCGTNINLMRGFSNCELCEQPSQCPIVVTFEGEKLKLGAAEIRVVGPGNKIYASPNMIFHYVLEHKYLPPEEFIEAVLTGYLPNSKEYASAKLKYQWKEIA